MFSASVRNPKIDRCESAMEAESEGGGGGRLAAYIQHVAGDLASHKLTRYMNLIFACALNVRRSV